MGEEEEVRRRQVRNRKEGWRKKWKEIRQDLGSLERERDENKNADVKGVKRRCRSLAGCEGRSVADLWFNGIR